MGFKRTESDEDGVKVWLQQQNRKVHSMKGNFGEMLIKAFRSKNMANKAHIYMYIRFHIISFSGLFNAEFRGQSKSK